MAPAYVEATSESVDRLQRQMAIDAGRVRPSAGVMRA